MIGEIDLSNLSTGIPKIDYSLGVREALKVFEEHGIYDFLVVVKDNKPLGIVKKSDLVKAQQRHHLIVGDLTHHLMRLRATNVKLEDLIYLLNFFNISKHPLLVVNRKGNYVGILFYQVVLHHISLFKEATLPIFQKIASFFGQDCYFYCFYIKGIRSFMEQLGSPAGESLQKILYEGVKTNIRGEVSLSYKENEVYVLSREMVKEEDIKSLYEEFHREYALLYAQEKPLYLHGYCIPLKDVNGFEDFFKATIELKKRMDGINDVSIFIFHGEKPSVVLCEYKRREFIYRIKQRIKQDFENIVEVVRKSDKDLWEFILYDLFKVYPYFELFYIMGESGLQVSNNVVNPKINYPIKTGKKGTDRSEKDYFKRANYEDVYISNIYISQATDDFCITVSKRFTYGEKGYTLAGDINYREIHRLVKEYAKEG